MTPCELYIYAGCFKNLSCCRFFPFRTNKEGFFGFRLVAEVGSLFSEELEEVCGFFGASHKSRVIRKPRLEDGGFMGVQELDKWGECCAI